MKRILLTLSFLLITSGVSAAGLYIDSPVASVSPTTANGGFNPAGSISGFSVISGSTFGTIGSLMIDGPGTVAYTFLGKEAGFNNFFFDVGGVPVDTITDISGNIGVTSAQTYLAASSLLNFSFGTAVSSGGGGVVNGFATNNTNVATFVIFGGQNSGYQYILGYDDSGAGPDRDFDDMVIGVNFLAPVVTTPVPEPEIYAMMAAGLGLMGFVARRRKQNGAVS